MIPYRDSNPGIRTPILTVTLIAVSVVVFFVVQGGRTDARDLYELALVPCEITTGQALDVEEIATRTCITEPLGSLAFPDKSILASAVISVFLHGGLLHLATNMLSLWIFGDNVEDALGRWLFPLFYLAGGVLAASSHVVLNPSSVSPLVGASGAIAGVMGMYVVLFPRARIHTLIVPFFFFRLPAVVFLVIWFISQFFLAGEATSVAWEAHVGGFVYGLGVGLLFRRPLVDRLNRLRFPFGFERQPPPLPRRRR